MVETANSPEGCNEQSCIILMYDMFNSLERKWCCIQLYAMYYMLCIICYQDCSINKRHGSIVCSQSYKPHVKQTCQIASSSRASCLLECGLKDLNTQYGNQGRSLLEQFVRQADWHQGGQCGGQRVCCRWSKGNRFHWQKPYSPISLAINPN